MPEPEIETVPNVFLIKKGEQFISIKGLNDICKRLDIPELTTEDAWRFRMDVPPRALTLRQFYQLRSNVRRPEAA